MAVVTRPIVRPVARPGVPREVVVSAITVLTVLVAWVVVTMLFRVSPMVLPSPPAMRDELANLLSVGYAGKPLYLHIAKSLFRSLTGLVAGLVLASPIGLAM